MPLSFSEEGEELADKRPCALIRAQLKYCLLDSDCCKKEKVLPRECLKRQDNTVPDECRRLAYSFFECKRSIVSVDDEWNADNFACLAFNLLDMRTRFRGRKGETYATE